MCDKVVCVLKMRVCVWQNYVCERLCATKLCVCVEVACVAKFQSWPWATNLWKMVCDKVVCDKVVCKRLCVTKRCVTKLCAKDGVIQSCVWKMMCDKAVCDKEGCDKVVCKRCMLPSAMPATKSAAAPQATNGAQARHQSQPSVISAATATQMLRPCRQMPRLPRKCYVHVTKCRACHAKSRWMSPNATLAAQSAVATRATNGDQRATRASKVS